ncbi:hypothetical protein Smp_194060 [Schistosoma mansoni]|uniref:hypothetical protein n=1 Tax=Schistosoma mansoni TaxID=6183 RepID=UPI00022C8304|nr:hypothetical protein Smp_194060 [Schistosoma mansoni]|eukprot:XP_018644631.1 hypothetical protein Smp_194060 [Schistosoma mansoni]
MYPDWFTHMSMMHNMCRSIKAHQFTPTNIRSTPSVITPSWGHNHQLHTHSLQPPPTHHHHHHHPHPPTNTTTTTQHIQQTRSHPIITNYNTSTPQSHVKQLNKCCNIMWK